MSADLCITNARTAAGEPIAVAIRGGVIQSLVPSPAATVLDAQGAIVSPGFIEMQVNGAGGIDFTRKPERVFDGLGALASQGITDVLPTLITAAETTRAAALSVNEPPAGYRGPDSLGWHFEGPWLAPSRRGAHPAEHLRGIPKQLPDWPGVRLVTLAPELPGATAAITELTRRGVLVSCGHSDASADAAHAAFDAGARMVTHLFNAMAPLHHRRPGLVGAALRRPDVALGLIADGVHVDPDVIALVFSLAPERLVLVSDAIAFDESGGGLGDQRPQLVDGVPRLPDGTLAGSALRLDAAVRNLKAITGCSDAAALRTVTETPARILGLDRQLAPGRPANLVLLDESLTPRLTLCRGQVLFDELT